MVAGGIAWINMRRADGHRQPGRAAGDGEPAARPARYAYFSSSGGMLLRPRRLALLTA